MQHIEVVYENGLLRPLGPLPDQLHEREHYFVTIETPTARSTRRSTNHVLAAPRETTPAADLDEVRRVLAGVRGTLAAAVAAAREERQD